MVNRVVDPFPAGDACPVCGRQLRIHYDTPTYRTASCTKMKGHCGWWGYESIEKR